MTARPAALDVPEEEDGRDLSHLSERQKARVQALEQIVEDHSQFPKPESGYEPRSLRGWSCSECVFYQGEGEPQAPCDLVEGPVRADAVCDLYIPDEPL